MKRKMVHRAILLSLAFWNKKFSAASTSSFLKGLFHPKSDDVPRKVFSSLSMQLIYLEMSPTLLLIIGSTHIYAERAR